MGIIIAVLILIVLLIIVLISRVNIRLTYYRKNEDDELIIIVSALFGLINFKSEFNFIELLLSRDSMLEIKGEVEATAKGKLLKEFGKMVSIDATLEHYKKYKLMTRRYGNVIRYMGKKIAVNKLKWDTVLGTGDAAVTGIAIGMLWNVKTVLSSLLNSRFKLISLPQISIIPCFDGLVFSTHFDCILSVKIGHAITAGMIGLIAKKKDGDAIE